MKALKILSFLKDYKRETILNIVFNLLSALFAVFSITMISPFLSILFGTQKPVTSVPEFSMSIGVIKTYIYYYLSQVISSEGKQAALVLVGTTMIFFTLLKTLFRYLGIFHIVAIRNSIIRDLRKKIYEKIIILPLSYYSKGKKGDIISRITNDVKDVEWGVINSIEAIFRDPLTIILYLTTLFIMNYQLTLFVLVMLIFGGFILGRVSKSLKKYAFKAQGEMGNIISVVEETLSGMKIIKAFNAQKRMRNKFDNINDRYKKIMMKVERRRDLASPMSEFLGTIIMVVILWYGASIVLEGTNSTITPEGLITYLTTFYLVIAPAKSFSSSFYNIKRGAAAVDRINEVLNAEEVIEDIKNPVDIKNFEDKIEIKNLNFKYENEQVLKNINLTIKKGKTIALVGESGAGKSTLVDLLPRFYDIEEGEILIDNQNIKNFRISSLRSLFGIVSQEAVLFNDTFFNNITLRDENASKEEATESAKIANAHNFIMEYPINYSTNIGDRGDKLSGGQKQRVSIARAVLNNPPILILDEATSALDSESEKLVQEAITSLMKNHTSIVIAHRLSTITSADEIIVMQKGEIIERGNHKELLAKDGHYKKLYSTQYFG